MDAYARSGRRAEAVQQYQECCHILQKDLGVEPSRETGALYRRIVGEA
jgi:DNA-binding SARP family transcriptional activator